MAVIGGVGEIVDTVVSVETDSQSADATDVCDSDIPVTGDQPQPTDVVDSFGASEVISSSLVDLAGKVASEREEPPGENSTSADLHGLPEDEVVC